MRNLAVPSPRVRNPDVEPQRPGWCVRHPGLGMWWGDGFMRDHRKAKVFLFEASAKRAAECLAGAEVTTVPRFNGHVVVWEEVPS